MNLASLVSSLGEEDLKKLERLVRARRAPTGRRVKLTAAFLKDVPLPADRAQVLYMDSEVRGLGVCVGATGARSFFLRKRGRHRVIGRWPEWTLEQARARARELIVAIDKGLDPEAEERKKTAKGITLQAALEEYVAKLKAAGKSPRSVEAAEGLVPRYLAAWLGRPLSSLDPMEVRDRHKKISDDHGPVVANRALEILRALYRVARKVYPTLPEDPTRAVNWNKTSSQRPPIPWAQLPAWRGGG